MKVGQYVSSLEKRSDSTDSIQIYRGISLESQGEDVWSASKENN